MPELDFPKPLVWRTRCGHSLAYQLTWATTFCGLCFLQEGYADEVPTKLHMTKTLALNGKPDQTGAFQAHVRVVEGIVLPVDGEALPNFRRRRAKINTHEPHFPFSTALWLVAGRQPPLAKPLIKAVVERKDHQTIQMEMGISLLNLVERMRKGVDMAANYVQRTHA